MPLIIGIILLIMMLWPSIVAGLAWLVDVLTTMLMWAAGGALAVGAVGMVCHFLILPLAERRLDRREAEQAQRARRRAGLGTQAPGRPNFAPPSPGAIGPPKQSDGQRWKAAHPPKGGVGPPATEKPAKQADPEPTSEINPGWQNSSEAS